MEFPVKVAVATKEGKAVSEHFGHAKRFAIYEVTPESVRLLEEREVERYCLGGDGNASAMPGILAAIHDCQAVLVAKIGNGPTEKLRAIGVAAVSDYAWEPIDEALLTYARRLAGGLKWGRTTNSCITPPITPDHSLGMKIHIST
jgi:predicted Fe-Mo cluster-binding NifX family protein